MPAFGAIFASGAITAVGWIPFAMMDGSRKSAAAFANATFTFSARSTVLPATVSPGGRTTHFAADVSARAVCFGESTKIKSLDEARSGAATPVSSTEASPSTVAPSASAKSFAVCFMTPPKLLIREDRYRVGISQEIVKRRFACRPGFPACVYPDPLLRIFSNDFFGDLRKSLRVFKDVARGVAGANQLQRRFEPQPVFPQRFIPHSIARYHRGSVVKGDARDAGGCAGGHAKKVHEYAFFRHGVLVGKDSDRACVLQNLEHGAGGLIFKDWCVAGKASATIHQRIEPRIIERPGHVMQGIAIKGMRERRQLPRAHVRRKKEHAFSTTLAFQKIFLAIEDNHFLDIFSGVARHARKLCGHPAEAAHHTANCCRALRVGPLRKRQLQIEFSCLAQLRRHREQDSRNRHSQRTRQPSRQRARNFKNNPYDCERQPFLHRWTLC